MDFVRTILGFDALPMSETTMTDAIPPLYYGAVRKPAIRMHQSTDAKTPPALPLRKRKRRFSTVKESSEGAEYADDDGDESDSLIPDDAEVQDQGQENGNRTEHADAPNGTQVENPAEVQYIHASYAIAAPDFTPGATTACDMSKVKPAAKPRAEAPAPGPKEKQEPGLEPATADPGMNALLNADSKGNASESAVAAALAAAGVPVSIDPAGAQSMAKTMSLFEGF